MFLFSFTLKDLFFFPLFSSRDSVQIEMNSIPCTYRFNRIVFNISYLRNLKYFTSNQSAHFLSNNNLTTHNFDIKNNFSHPFCFFSIQLIWKPTQTSFLKKHVNMVGSNGMAVYIAFHC